MTSGKYYRVKQDTFMWKKGAILKHQSSYGSSGGYEAIEDIWDACPLDGEYISARIIEAAENDKYFERVYPTPDETGFLTKPEAQKLYEGGSNVKKS